MTYTAVNAILTERDRDTIARYARAGADVRADARAVRDPQRAAAAARLGRLRSAAKPKVILDDGGTDRGHRRLRAQHRAPHHRRVHAAGERDRGASPRIEQRMPALYRIHEPPDPLKVLAVRRVRDLARLQPRRRRPARSSRCTSRSWWSKIRGTPEERPIALLMLRTMQKARYDPMNVGHFGLAARNLHPLHVADPALSRSRRPSPAARAAAARSVTDERREELRRGAAGDRAPHLGDGAARRRSRARAACSGRRSASWPTRSATNSTATSPASRAFGLFVELIEHFVEGHGPRLDDGGRLLPLQRADAHAVRGEHQEEYRLGDRVARAGRPRRSRAAADRPRPRATCSTAVRDDERRRGPARSQARPRRSSGRRRRSSAARHGRRAAQEAAAGRRARPGRARRDRQSER